MLARRCLADLRWHKYLYCASKGHSARHLPYSPLFAERQTRARWPQRAVETKNVTLATVVEAVEGTMGMYSGLQGKWRYGVAVRGVIQYRMLLIALAGQAWLLIGLYILVIMHAATEPCCFVLSLRATNVSKAGGERRIQGPCACLPRASISSSQTPNLTKLFSSPKILLCALRANRARPRALPAANGMPLLSQPHPLYHHHARDSKRMISIITIQP